MTRYEISTDDDMVYVSAAEDDYDEAARLGAQKLGLRGRVQNWMPSSTIYTAAGKDMTVVQLS